VRTPPAVRRQWRQLTTRYRGGAEALEGGSDRCGPGSNDSKGGGLLAYSPCKINYIAYSQAGAGHRLAVWGIIFIHSCRL
jgi:hypothetical protein